MIRINTKKTGNTLFNWGLVLLAISIPVSIFFMGVAVGFLGAAFLIKIFTGELKIIKTGLEIPLGLFILAYLISTILGSPEPWESLKYIFNKHGWMFCMVFMIYMFKPEHIWKFLKLMAWSAVVAGIYTVVQGFSGWALLGGLAASIEEGLLSSISMGRDRIAPVTEFLGITLYRGSGVFSHHLDLGGQMAMLSFVSWTIIKKKRYFMFIPAALFFSFAYSAWGGFILGLIYILAVKNKKVIYGLAVLVVFTSIFLSVPGNISVVKEKFSGRLAIWEASIHMYKSSPIVGIGAGRYTPRFKENNYREKFPHLPTSGSKVHPHSIYLSMLVRGGAVTFAAFLFFLLKFMQLYIRPPKDFKFKKFNKVYDFLWAALFSVFSAGIFQTYLTSAQNSVLIWTLIGIIISLKYHYSQKSKDGIPTR